MNIIETKQLLKTNSAQEVFKKLYREEKLDEQVRRYEELLDVYSHTFGNDDVELFSSPGRVEVIGNHTDHNNGKVIAASIDMDCISVASKTDESIIEINDITYRERICIDINHIENTGETDSTALIKGMLAGFKQFGYKTGGFKACVSSRVIPAAGLSSSASFEMLICAVINHFYNNAGLDVITCSKIGKYAENIYWKKQSGMLDQMGCAVGGLVTIDFKDSINPMVEQIDCQFINDRYEIVIVNTGKSHANLNNEYSSIPIEMKKIANELSAEVCRNITINDVCENFPMLREKGQDRAILRVLHYLTENQRVDEMVKAIQNNEYDEFIKSINESGNSSWKWLQNCYCTSNVNEQGIPLALALTELFLIEKEGGACRVHGGGFAGVIMAVLPKDMIGAYANYISKYFGSSNVFNVHIRKHGSVCINTLI